MADSRDQQINTKVAVIKDLDQKIESLQPVLVDLEKEKEEKEVVIKSLEDKITNLQGSIVRLEDVRRTVEDDIKSRQKEFNRLDEDLTFRHERKKSELQHLENQISDKKKEFDTVSTMIRVAYSDKERILGELKKAKEAEDEFRSLRTQIREESEKFESLKKEHSIYLENEKLKIDKEIEDYRKVGMAKLNAELKEVNDSALIRELNARALESEAVRKDNEAELKLRKLRTLETKYVVQES